MESCRTYPRLSAHLHAYCALLQVLHQLRRRSLRRIIFDPRSEGDQPDEGFEQREWAPIFGHSGGDPKCLHA